MTTKEDTMHEQKHPLTDHESTIMTPGAQSAETEFVRLKVEDSMSVSMFDSYTSLGDEYNEIGASIGEDMNFSQSVVEASHTIIGPPTDRLSSSTADYEANPTSFVPYTEACHPTIKIDNSQCSLDRIAQVPDACVSSFPAGANINLYESKNLGSDNPYIHTAPPYNGFLNVSDDSFTFRHDNYRMAPVSFSSSGGYAQGDSSMSNPQESSVQNPFAYPLGINMPQNLYLQHNTMKPLNSDIMSVQPCDLSLNGQQRIL